MRIPIIDPGHGGFSWLAGTYATSPDKMFVHNGLQLHDGASFFEGVFNRQVAIVCARYLAHKGIPYLFTVPVEKWETDISLEERVEFANVIDSAPGVQTSFWSIHANAFDGNARGFEVYTSPNDTPSDQLAEELWLSVEAQFDGLLRMREDLTDGDHDKEDRFFVLTRTRMPAVLIEWGFFDNPTEAQLLCRPEFIDRAGSVLASNITNWVLKK